MELALFLCFAGVAVVSALGMLLNLRNTVAAALCLVVTLLAIACLFVMLGAQFIGIVQVMIYAGAIVVLFLFVIMLLNLRGDRMGAETRPWLKLLGVLIAAGVTLKLVGLVSGFALPWSAVDPEFGTTSAVGRALYTDYLLPFELASVLLLSGIVGAVVLAKRRLD